MKILPATTQEIQATFGEAAPIDFRGPVKVRCVCDDCNHGWMSDLEGTVKPFVQAMIKDLAVTLNFDQQKSVAAWAMKTAMVLEAASRRRNYPNVFSREHCEQLRLEFTIPDRTLIWLGRMSDAGVFASGTHVWLDSNVSSLACDGQVATFVAGHLALQVLTIIIPPQDQLKNIRTPCHAGPWDDSLLGIYPANQPITWPPRLSFSARGPLLFVSLRDRFKIGRKRVTK